MLLGVSIGSVAVVSGVSFVASRNALSDNVTDQLTSTRVVLARQVESFFTTIEGQAASLAEDGMVIEALAEFSVGWDQLVDAELDDPAAEALTAAYERFAAGLPETGSGELVEELVPTASNARYLQYQYAVAGEDEDEDPAEVVDVDDGTF